MAPASFTTTGAPTSPINRVDVQVLHVARRLTFGPTPPLLREMHEMGVESWLQRQFDPSSIDDTETDRRLWALTGLGFDLARLAPAAAGVADGLGLMPTLDGTSQLLATTAMTLDELEATLFPLDRGRIARVLAELRLATVVRATYSERQVLEQMVDLWWNHFNIYPWKHAIVAGMMPSTDREVIRPHALGTFADLLQASASSPAMLAFLDNWQNRAGEPNENFGRELLELHTVGVESGFTEQDVREATRVFTGWTVGGPNWEFRFEPDWHDTGPKRVLGWSTPGISGSGGVQEGRSLLEHLAYHPATARTVSTKIARRFVADDPSEGLVASAAETYLSNGTAIVPVLHHIVTSAEFAASAGTKVRRPLDFFVGALRAVDADIGDPIGPSTEAGQTIDHTLRWLGQRPFDAQSPAGYPERADLWLGAGVLPHWSVAHDLVRGSLSGIDVDTTALIGDATGAGAICDTVLARLHGATEPDRREALLAGLGVAEHDELDAARFPEVVGLALCAAEAFQR